MAKHLKSIFKKIEHMGGPDPLPPSSNIPPPPQFDAFDPVVSEVYRHRKQVGVNLGCLFCLEGWLAPPSLKSSGIRHDWDSEIDYLEACESREIARDSLEQHWKSYITEQDFEYLASTGINAVRLPIGYWAAADQEDLTGPFKKFQGVYDAAWNYFLIVIHNAAKYNIGVLVDLHGAPGGQNCDSHSGASSGQAQLFTMLGSHNQSITLKVLLKLATTLAPINNVIGLELLNEPQDDASLPGFYLDVIRNIRQATPNIRLPIYIGDAWNVDKYSEFLAKHQAELDFCVLDTHQYFCHMPADHAKTAEQHTKHLTTGLKSKLSTASQRIRGNMVVGEWSVVLNGKSIPKGQHDGQVMKEFGCAEMQVWNETCAGQFYWTYKTADDGWYWSFIYCIKNNIMPQPVPGGGFITQQNEHVIQSIQEQKESSLNGAFNSHVNYWSQQKNQHVVDNAWRFQEGFRTGYDVALRFIQGFKSHVGFIGQLAHEYAQQHCNQDQNKQDASANAWQFEHGFSQAIGTVNKALKQAGMI
ncbi:glycoside hydrolase superfamily [Phascolomyces articulosus]|uniref:Glycoside hydrolase superfamily n=1 Tax=Phascolomyces articulosus TaxID=60185 RepID=A0AAD5L020_9FUNG|nr:glycoside hydrolase superfamily [Phascolomyces articulosus]